MVLKAWAQPVVALQVSVVQLQPSSQFFLVNPAWHLPALQKSPTVHALPSVQVVPTNSVKMHLPAASHASLVQTLLSLHGVAGPGLHLPSLQASPTVQLLPSLHTPPVAGVNTHDPVLPSHLSVVHGVLSLHATGMPPPHRPLVHFSPLVHRSLSLH